MKEYLFIIDTDKYAGNFEREMCAYMTGLTGDCGVGYEIAEKAQEEILPDYFSLLEDIVAQKPDDNGCYRPVSIWSSEGGGMNSVCIFFNEKIPEDLQSMLIQRASQYVGASVFGVREWNRSNLPGEILGFRYGEVTTTTKIKKIAYTDPDKAINEARRLAKEYCTHEEDYEEHDYGKDAEWLFYADYSCEGDHVYVHRVELIDDK